MKFKHSIFLFLCLLLSCLSIPVVKANPVPMEPLIRSDLLVPYLLFFFPATVFMEFFVYYIALAKEIDSEKINRKNLFEIILFINSLTFPLALIFEFLFVLLKITNLFVFILLIEMIVISLESIIFRVMIDNQSNPLIPNSKIIGFVCIANILSMLIGFLPVGLLRKI